ncbi:putative heat-shock related protein [Fulvivirga imtechensis AK7]|uniref:Putative heat-shock related protein n=1 Tax=Fulvivirga imtechensis AK7 TaxID=1237149 RepID=L8JPD7_9BACT|nr:Hsp20/alpha crystallin family protein [Fulvivirga imtechensis]ELR70073.1 putative heat-shock related protein [Fulvivirga imtechensis AK7]
MLYGLDQRRKRQDFNEGFWDGFTNRDVLEDYPIRERSDIPAVNVVENKQEYILELAAPGMCKEDYKLEVEDNILTISGESEKRNTENQERSFIRNEFTCSYFSRSFILPEHINSDEISASCSEGILTIHIPKKEEAMKDNRRQIDIS